MNYNIRFTRKALKEGKKIPKNIWYKIKDKISLLESNPFPQNSKRLEDVKVLYRLRIGDYRVVYEVKDNELIILVIKIVHRKEVYKKII